MQGGRYVAKAFSLRTSTQTASLNWRIGMTELEVAMWRHRPQDAARIDASLADPGQLIGMTAEHFDAPGAAQCILTPENSVPEKADGE